MGLIPADGRRKWTLEEVFESHDDAQQQAAAGPSSEPPWHMSWQVCCSFTCCRPCNGSAITQDVCDVQMGEQRLVWNDEMKLRLIKVQLLGQQNTKACNGMLSPAMVLQVQGWTP